MKLVSYFAGAGGIDLGFMQAGFDVVAAYEWDKYAVESYKANIDPDVEVSDVTELVGADIPKADVWSFGFPCQDLSLAGKQAGIHDGARSKMFFEVMRLLGEVEEKPQIILAENVKGLKKYLPVLQEEYEKAGYRMYYTIYNSKFWGVPQNRERYFVIGVRNDIPGDFVFADQQTEYVPKLVSVLETDVPENYYMREDKVKVIIERLAEGLKVRQATKQGWDLAIPGDTVNVCHPSSKTRRGRVGKQIAQTLTTGTEQIVLQPTPLVEKMLQLEANIPVVKDRGLLRETTQGVATCIDAHYSCGMDNHGQRTSIMVHNIYGGFKEKTPRVFEDYSPTIRTSAGGGHLPSVAEWTGCSLRTRKYAGKPQALEYRQDEISNAVTGVNKDYMAFNPSEWRIRKLTPREAARLQGFPDSYKQVVSDTQFYKQMGNAVTVNVSYAIALQILDFLVNADGR